MKIKWKQRELEFRVWHVNYEKWVENSGTFPFYKLSGSPTRLWVWDNSTEDFEEIHAIVTQYTGVKDVNGKKIFEGDIVNKLPYPDCPDWIGYIKYEVNGSGFIVHLIGDTGELVRMEVDFNSVILGNVFQNPELVEKYKLEGE